jgi:hypothetical protein
MNPIRKPAVLWLLLLAAGLASCNLPTQATVPTPDPWGTLTALAGEATLTPAATELPTETPTITPTPTPSVPTASVSQDTNCRTGPGVVYDFVVVFKVGQQAEVVGKHTPSGYWIIKTPGGSGSCWLWGHYASVGGNTAGLPEYPTPPTPTPSIPAAPANFAAAKICALVIPGVYNYQFGLTWEDKADNEDGYRIYFNGGLLVTLPAGSTSHLHTIGVMGAGVPFTYEVEAYNVTGASEKKSIVVTCP